ncbi:tyrosine-type recombinase/integrase [Paenibacillus alvei]|uniref:Tyrosine-type recombinase/integrase n=1 Tax=Paenibacillus alvei TaxID=44250 RepID=A0AAP7A5J3_PAEAL|nr:tyrosine-type recombinase/integrase [Paenibacillus alvei]
MRGKCAQGKAKALIQKPVTVHSLRYSFVTYLLEAGTDLRYIQELLGHQSSQTMERYTHVSNERIRRIRSPLNRIMGEMGDGRRGRMELTRSLRTKEARGSYIPAFL